MLGGRRFSSKELAERRSLGPQMDWLSCAPACASTSVVRVSWCGTVLTPAMAALGIPTTRALAILTSGVVVIRENGPEPSSVVARMAPSFIRIGHFEALCPGEVARNTHNLFLGGGWKTEKTEADEDDALGGQGNLEGLRDLTKWVKDGVMGQETTSVKDWFKEVVRLNAETTAAWQVYGFMHGVLVGTIETADNRTRTTSPSWV